MPVLPIAVIIIVAAVALAAYGWYAAQKRKKELAAWAAANGLSFDPGKDYGIEGRYPAVECFRQGDNRYGYNLIAGQLNGRRIYAFDYHYQTYSHSSKGGRQTHHYYFSAVALVSAVPLRPLLIRPEGLLDKVTEFFGADDIDFESGEFSRKFFVKSPDRKWAYDVIHQRTMEFLLSMPRYHIQFDGRDAVAFRSSTFSVTDLDMAARTLGGILDRLPDYLLRQQQGEA